MYTQGNKTLSTFDVGPESHKLFQEFAVKASAQVYRGQPVKLSGDNEIEPLASADPAELCIGVAMMNGHSMYRDLGDGDSIPNVEYIAVALRGYAIINGLSTANTVVGPVKYAGYDTASAYPDQAKFGAQKEHYGYSKFSSLTLTTTPGAANLQQIGWALEASAAAGNVIRILIKD